MLVGLRLKSIIRRHQDAPASRPDGAGMEKLRAILQRVRPGFDAELSPCDVIGPQFGFSSIEQVRVIAQIESALDIDLADEGVSVLNVGKLCQLLERSGTYE